MKKILAIVALLTAILPVFGGEITVEGVYQGKNLYVMNPYASSGVGFCVYEVRVNGQMSTDEIASSAFEIDLSIFKFKPGDKVSVSLLHKGGCTPKVVNPEVLKPKSSFNVTAIKFGKDKILRWTTTGESGALTYTVEQFRWNKWIKVGEVEGKGTAGANNYMIELQPNMGDNQFRVKQVDYTKVPRYSKPINYKNIGPKITYGPEKRISTQIQFSAPTMYEIYDAFGQLMVKGFGATADVSSLPASKKYPYTLLYDNQTATFLK